MDQWRGIQIDQPIEAAIAGHARCDVRDSSPDFGAAHGIASELGFQEQGWIRISTPLKELVHGTGTLLQVTHGVNQNSGFIPADGCLPVDLLDNAFDGRAAHDQNLKLPIPVQAVFLRPLLQSCGNHLLTPGFFPGR